MQPSRLDRLQKMLAGSPDDPFLYFAIAMEHRKAGRTGEALEWFTRTLQKDPAYCVAYHQAALTHLDAGNAQSARQTFEEGIMAARKKGDSHAAREMEEALAMINA